MCEEKVGRIWKGREREGIKGSKERERPIKVE
jgi:hypothetical protein